MTGTWKAMFGIVLATVSLASATATVTYTLVNNTVWPDDQVYVTLVGKVGGHVWMNCATSQIVPMNVDQNTLAGPVNSGNTGPGGQGMYADCFTKLSDIPEKKLTINDLSGSRIFMSFGAPLSLYFFGYEGGYAGPDLNNPTDPNSGIVYEIIELANDQYGIWTNTTRVDGYHLPMGLELFGDNGYYAKTGELVDAQTIVDTWKSDISSAFQGCLKEEEGLIEAPSKTPAFKEGGAQADFFQGYIDAIWAKYANEDLTFTSDAGVWQGRVAGEQFVFHNLTNSFGNATAYIRNRPNTQEALEGKGVLADDVQGLTTQSLDKVVQAQFCAALNRHAIDLDAAPGATQDWSDSSKYFKTAPYNEYVQFWHRRDISYNGMSYGFCYDDVYNWSSTIHTPSPTAVTVTIGGFYQPTAVKNELSTARAGSLHLQVDPSHMLISGLDRGAGRIGLYTLAGKHIADAACTNGSAKFAEPLSAGLYLWQVKTGKGVHSGQLSVH